MHGKRMAVKKTIAIIGATGATGGVIARWLAKSGYRLLLISTEQNELREMVSELAISSPAAEVEGMDCMFNASWEADLVIMAVPARDEQEVACRISEVTRGKTVISISSRIDDSAKPNLQQLLPYSRVMKLYHTGNLHVLSSTLASFLN